MRCSIADLTASHWTVLWGCSTAFALVFVLFADAVSRRCGVDKTFGYADVVVLSTQPTDAEFSGSAAGGQTRAVVDADGRLVELTVDALLLRRPPRGGRRGDPVRRPTGPGRGRPLVGGRRLSGPGRRCRGHLDPARLAADVAAAEREADRRLSELSAIVSDLIRHQDRRP